MTVQFFSTTRTWRSVVSRIKVLSGSSTFFLCFFPKNPSFFQLLHYLFEKAHKNMDIRKYMTLSEWANLNGMSYNHASYMFNKGKIPNAEKVGRRVFVKRDDVVDGIFAVDADAPKKCITYVLVGIPKLKWEEKAIDLTALLQVYAWHNDLDIIDNVQEYGFCDDNERKKLLKVLVRRDWEVLLVPDKETISVNAADALIHAIEGGGRKVIILQEQYE